ncbi:restriction endonuclease subunit S [Methylopila henanensis]|uniref:Restriction endonuclease subunit S n=1 Tax=Methylopila henanensis TaxID=873516 RepID=A0ABW4K774_9HYPH
MSLGDVADVFNGKTPAKSEQREAGHPVLKIRDVDDGGRFREKFGSFVDQDYASQFSKKQVLPGDTLILNAAHNADYVGSKSFFATEDVRGALATGEWLLVRPNHRRLDPGFAHYWLTSAAAQAAIRDQVKGIHLYPKDVARLNIPLPPLDEQRRLAAILDKADALRRKRKRALELLDGLTQSIFLEMFGDIACGGNSIKKKAEFNTHDWHEGIIGDQIVLQRGKDITKKEAIFGDVPVISSGGISFYHNEKIAPGPGVLLGRKGSVGNVHFTDTDFWPHDTTLYVKEFRGNLPEFVYCYFKRFPIENYEASAANPSLNRNNIHPVKTLWPKLNLQERFSSRLRKVWLGINNATAQLASSEALFASLQHRAFSGQL